MERIDLTQFDGHTEGDWRTEPCNHGGVLIYRGSGIWANQIAPAVDGELMAAAPTLKAALVEAYAEIDRLHSEMAMRVEAGNDCIESLQTEVATKDKEIAQRVKDFEDMRGALLRRF